MRKSIVWGVLALAMSTLSLARETPKAEVFGGYQYTRINPGSGVDGENSNGWNGAIQANLNHYLGVKADFSGAYRTSEVGIGGEVRLRQYTYLFGPVLSARAEKATLFAHALFGGARATADTTVVDTSDSAFAMALGGGLDYNVSPRFALRVAQFDYLPTFFGDDKQHNVRYSAGVVFRF